MILSWGETGELPRTKLEDVAPDTEGRVPVQHDVDLRFVVKVTRARVRRLVPPRLRLASFEHGKGLVESLGHVRQDGSAKRRRRAPARKKRDAVRAGRRQIVGMFARWTPLLLSCFLLACDTGETTRTGDDTGGTASTGGAPGVGGSGSGVGGGASSTGGTAGAGSTAAVSGSGSTAAVSGSGSTAAVGGSGGGGSDEPAPDSAFTLLFRDELDTLDPSRWSIMTHSWDTNLALFSAKAVSNADGRLSLTLLPAPEGTTDGSAPKSFLGAEVRSVATLTYGRVRTRAKLARGSAVVSSLVTIYTPWPADNWNELDIECLGQDPSQVQFNAMVYTGAPVTPPVTSSVSPTQDPTKVSLGFDSSEDFHVYEIEWTPEGAFFRVDDVLRHTWTKRIDLMTLPQNVLLTIWASSSAAWAGPVTAATRGAASVYDWIELYEFTPGG
ncbi:glycoside hydrolase family 16 protein [Sorangium sp. So ce362]|uniref:glycoside hydrolase family 16 protein n=1 Tax=Sorangium sp. So ce362 TaxID=3133303 RepID=UPI003F6045F5